MEETSDSGYIYVHKHIDSLPMFCNWTIDVVFLVFVFCEAGLYFASSFMGTFIFVSLGVILGYFYSKIKNNSIKGYFQQLLYRINFIEPKTLVPSYKRTFLGA